MAIESFNPATEEKIRSYRALTKSEIAEKLQKSRGAFEEWRLLGVDQRASFMKKAADRLLSDKDRYAALMALEMGKPFSQGKKEAEKCASVCEYYAKNAESFLKPETIQTEASKSYVAFEPMGAVLAVMPWNFPFWQVFRAAAPALMAGNVMALKHAANVQGCAEAIEKVFLEAGFPEGVFSNFTIESSQAGDLIESPLV
ncbi:MAG TPA: aldehyde dehydrogenase family protein, partial [Candidatus Omnitrophota bacterium]|nr:aldehyde dehydrogenase family protein [Candidatus Omnitrophota bacterium]